VRCSFARDATARSDLALIALTMSRCSSSATGTRTPLRTCAISWRFRARAEVLRAARSQLWPLNKRTLQHQATGELYALIGATPAAIEQFQLARKAADADFYVLSEVDARLRQLTQQMKEQREDLIRSASACRRRTKTVSPRISAKHRRRARKTLDHLCARAPVSVKVARRA